MFGPCGQRTDRIASIVADRALDLPLQASAVPVGLTELQDTAPKGRPPVGFEDPPRHIDGRLEDQGRLGPRRHDDRTRRPAGGDRDDLVALRPLDARHVERTVGLRHGREERRARSSSPITGVVLEHENACGGKRTTFLVEHGAQDPLRQRDRIGSARSSLADDLDDVALDRGVLGDLVGTLALTRSPRQNRIDGVGGLRPWRSADLRLPPSSVGEQVGEAGDDQRRGEQRSSEQHPPPRS